MKFLHSAALFALFVVEGESKKKVDLFVVEGESKKKGGSKKEKCGRVNGQEIRTCGNGDPNACPDQGILSYIGKCSCAEVEGSIKTPIACTYNGNGRTYAMSKKDIEIEEGLGYIGDGACWSNCDQNGFTDENNNQVKGFGIILDDACRNRNQENSCRSNGVNGYGIIGEKSCRGGPTSGDEAKHCQEQGTAEGFGYIGRKSCSGNGKFFCDLNGYASGVGVIMDKSCNGVDDSQFTCYNNGYLSGNGFIGNNSCNGGSFCCKDNGGRGKGYIGNGSCNNNSWNAGDDNDDTCFKNGSGSEGLGSIMDNACNAKGACANNQGIIGNGCCNYDGACTDNVGVIDKDNCACFDNCPPPTTKSP